MNNSINKGIPKSKIHRKRIGIALKKYLRENPEVRIGKNNPHWKGGIIYDKGRKLIYSPYHPKPDSLKKYCYEYKLIMEKFLGRFLNKEEIVHHINGNVNDNRIKNLMVMTQGEHCRLHKKQGDMNKRYNWKINRDSKGRVVSQTRGSKI